MMDPAQCAANKNQYGPIIRKAFVDLGVPAEWGMAFADWESGHTFDPNLKTMTGGDGDLGGSYGFLQMSFATAKSLGYTGEPAGLCDPVTNSTLAAKYMLYLQRHFVSSDLKDVAAGYNDGRRYDDPHLAPVTKNVYVPNILKLAAQYQLEFSDENLCNA